MSKNGVEFLYMLIFKCMNCGSHLQAEYVDIGELVECPECKFAQIIPEPVIARGGYFEEYMIKDLLASGLLWNSYHAQTLKEGILVDSVLKIPTGFLLKRVSSFKAMYDIIKVAGSSDMKEFQVLTDSSMADGRSYFAYEYVKNLRSISSFALNAPVRDADALKVARKVAAALSGAWSRCNIAHLNLNPDTVRLVISSLEVKISGYAVSSFLASESRLLNEGLNIWDFRYVCPEFIRDGKRDSQAFDIYSLGRILFFMLSGVHPPEHDEAGNPTGGPLTENLIAANPYLSMPIMALVNSMTEPDPRHRISTWDEAIQRIDAVLLEISPEYQVIEYRKKFNIWKGYTAPAARSRISEPEGLKAGRPEKKAYFASPGKKLIVNTPAGRVSARDAIRAVNMKWQMQRESSELASWKAMVIFLLLITVVAAAFICKQALSLPDAAPTDVEQPQQAVSEAPGAETVPVKTPDSGTTEPVRQKPAEVQGKPVSKSSLQEKYAEIEDFLKGNPEGFDSAIMKYEELKRPYVLENNAKLVGDINEKIFDLEKRKQEKVDKAVSDMLKSITPFLEKNEKDKAVLMLDSYSGRYAAETKRQRKEIARKILDGMSIVEINRGEAVKLLDDVMEKNTKLIAAGDFDNMLAEMKELLKKPKDEMVGQIISSYIVDIGEFKSLRSDLQKKIISEKALRLKLGSKPEGDEILLKALAYAELGDYEKAYENFEKMPYGTGYVFISVLSESEAVAALRRLLEKYGISYDAAQPDKLGETLYKKQIDSVQAHKLMDDLKAFESDFSASQAFTGNTLLLDSLTKYAFSHFSHEQKKKDKVIVVSSGGNAALNGQELLLMLEKANNFTTIYLKKGVYGFSRKGDKGRDSGKEKDTRLEQSSTGGGSFKLSLTGLKLIGEEGVVFEDDITITAQSVEISDIRMEKGKFSILPNNLSVLPDSGNIIVKNCYFNDLEARVHRGIDITFDNCFFRGLMIEKSKDVLLTHCTIIAQERGLSQNAALWVDGGNLKVANSVIYGNSLAVMFSEKGARILKESDIKTDKTIDISDTVFFGEQGLCSFQFENRPMSEEDIVKNPTRISRYCNPKRNIYYLPQFINSIAGNWRLVKGTPGYKGGSPKYKGGPLYYKDLKYGFDCGVIWPDSAGK